MKWFDLYQAEFGKSLREDFQTWEDEFAYAFRQTLSLDEVNQAIRDLKEQHVQTKCFEIRLPGPSDIVRQIRRNRRKGDDGGEFMGWIKAKLRTLHGDVEVFSAIVDPVGVLGAMRSTTMQEIVELLAWAGRELEFDETKARDELRRESDATARELSTDDPASDP